MMKKKMGFGLGHLRMASKPSNRPYDSNDGWPDGDDDEIEYISHVDTPFICRPPKLDSHTERELKRACAVILENLKPSGYDIEDTRMKSDILVDNPDLQKKYLGAQQPQSHRPQVAAPWNLGGAVDQSSSFVDSSRIIRDLEKRERPIKESHRSDHKITSKSAGHQQYHHHHHPQTRHPHQPQPHSAHHHQQTQPIRYHQQPQSSRHPQQQPHTSQHPHPLQSQPIRTAVAAENPPAPAPTAAQPTPFKSHTPHSRLPEAHRAGSSSTVSSINPGSTYDTRSEVTNVTSTAVTPSSGSKRVSDNQDDNATKVVSADSKTSEWMKETVSRRMRAETTTDTPKDSSESSGARQSPTPQPKKSWALFSKPDKKPAAAQVQTVVNGHATKISISRPKSSNELRTQQTNSGPVAQLTNVKSSDAKSISSDRPGSSGSLRSHLNLFKGTRVNELSQDALGSSRVRKEEIPPVPSIARLKDLDGLNGDSANRPPSLLTSITQALPKMDDSSSPWPDTFASTAQIEKPAEKNAEPRLPPKSPSRPVATHSPALVQNTVVSPKILRQEISLSGPTSPSVTSITSPRSVFGEVSTKRIGQAANADPEAADFDFLMGFMQDKSEQETLAKGGHEYVASRTKSVTSSPAQRSPFTAQMSVRSSNQTPSKMSSDLTRPNTSVPATNTHFIITNHSRIHTSSGLPPNSRLSTDPQAAHYLYGPGGATSGKAEARGVKKFFKRLGGGDSAKNVYVPTRDPYRRYNDEKSDDEDDWDDEACAAPVVGFGRGR